jgi:phage terminase small subunit
MDADATPDEKAEQPETPERPISQREQRFCEEYVIDLHGKRAAIRAGYSPKSAKFIASELLARPHVAAYLAQLVAERSARTRITADRVLAELAAIAFSDLRDYSCNDAGQMRLTAGAPSSAARAVKAIKREKHYGKEGKFEATVEFKLWPKDAALRHLMPHVGLVTEKSQTEVTGRGGAPIRFTLSLGDRSIEAPEAAREADEDKPA